MSDKIQNSFYLLKDSVTFYNVAKKTNVVENVDLKFLQKYLRGKKFKEQAINNGLSSDYEIWVYYKFTDPEIKWKDFMAIIVQSGQPILKHKKSFSESYIILFYSKSGKKFYASTGGYGHVAIQDIATNDLGIEILSRIVTAEDKALRATKERSITGGIQGSIKFFRNDYNLYENETFGSIYNELNAALDKDKLVKFFGFNLADLKTDSLCIAKNSFSLKKSISFKELLKIIKKCEDLLKKPAIVEINTVEKVNKTNTSLIDAIWNETDKLVFENYKDQNKIFSIEIGHKEFERYYFASTSKLTIKLKRTEYTLPIDGVFRDIQPILEYIRSMDSALTKDELNKCLSNAELVSYDTDGAINTSDPLKSHYCTEVVYNHKSYFLIEKDWYEIRQTMIDKINKSCTSFVKGKKYNGPLLKKWTAAYKKENDFNSSFLSDNDTLVFDKVLPDNIEPCDIMKWDKNHVYFFHVKKGFDNSMRDLCSQVLVAGRRVLEDTKSKYDFIGKLYDTLANSSGTTKYFVDARAKLANISKKDFIDLFKIREPVFVLAVLDTAKMVRTLENEMDKFDSNIAKFSLNELAKDMRNLDINFQIVQLEK